MHEVPAVVHDMPPGLDITLYSVIATPPFEDGAVHDTSEAPSVFEVAMTLVGTPGRVAGVAGADGAEAAPEPLAFLATTVNVKGVPFVRPVTVHEVEMLVQVLPPGLAVTV